jgi:phosphonate transport system substrate-binding protein
MSKEEQPMPRYPFSWCAHCHRLFVQYPRFVLTTLLLLFSLAQIGHAADKPQPVQIAITPCTDIMKTFKAYQPLGAYLERQLRQPVRLLIPRDFAEFERFVNQGAVEFTFQAPHTYVRLAHLYKREMLLKALTPEGEIKHRGVIIVRQDSPMRGIEDLKGKYVLFGAENDMAKSLAAKRLLAGKGISLDKDLRGYRHDGSCESIALNVFLKSADAGAVCDYSFKDINEPKVADESELPPNQLRILGHTEEIPTWVFAACTGVDVALIARINEALMALTAKSKEHAEIMASAEVGGFVMATDSDYDEVRKIVPLGREAR